MTHTFITTGKLLASSLIIAMAFSSTAMAQVKSSSTTPQTDVDTSQPNAISYGSTRSNTKGIAAPSDETPDVGDGIINGVQPEIDSLRSIVAPAGCVTEAGAKDVNCDVEGRRLPTGQNNVLARSAPVEGKQDVEDATAREETTRESLKTFSRTSEQFDEAEGLFSKR